jgi:membrane protease YdiL (CAAX protease family)
MPETTKERLNLPLFFVLLFIVCWVGTLPMILGSYGMKLPAAVRLLQVLMLFGPLIVACFASWCNEGRAGIKTLLRRIILWRANVASYLVALVLPPAVFLVSAVVSRQMHLGSIIFPAASQIVSTYGLTLLVYALLNTEEFAWRGYALPRMQLSMGVLKATLLITGLWTLFHMPLFLIKGGHPAGYPLWLFVLMIFAISPLFTIVFNGSRGSLLLPHLLHQSFNAAVESVPIYPRVTHSLFPILISISIFLLFSLLLWHKQGPPSPVRTE